MPEPTRPEKAKVTVVEIAGMLGLSRSRFYQLVDAGVFPPPSKDEMTHRPFYDMEGQRACLEVRRRCRGINGKPILFYARRRPLKPTLERSPSSSRSPRAREGEGVNPPSARAQSHILIDRLRQLGLVDLTEARISSAVYACFPGGIGSVPEHDVLRAVFRHLARENSRTTSGDGAAARPT